MSGLTSRLRALPADAVVVTAAMLVLYAAGRLPPGHPARVAVVLAVLLTIPGYVLTTATFPGYTSSPTTASVVSRGFAREERVASLSDGERAALSVGMSVVLLPLLGLALAWLGWPIRARTVTILTTAFVVLVGAVGVLRRAGLPPDVRYDLPLADWLTTAEAGIRTSPVEAAVNVVLAVAVLVAVATVAVAVVAPVDAERYTDVSLVTVDDDGQYVAGDYPVEFRMGQPRNLALIVTNHEGRTVDYTVVVQLQRVGPDGGVRETVELARYSQTVEPRGEWQLRHAVEPTMAGENLRVVWLVYAGDPPKDPSMRSAEEYVYLWIEVDP